RGWGGAPRVRAQDERGEGAALSRDLRHRTGHFSWIDVQTGAAPRSSRGQASPDAPEDTEAPFGAFGVFGGKKLDLRAGYSTQRGSGSRAASIAAPPG